MLFNSYTFLLLFLPITLVGFYSLLRFKNHNWAIGFLTFQSLFFYGWWDVHYVPLLLGSIAVNYCLALLINASIAQKKRMVFIIGILTNLALLGYYKYTGAFTAALHEFGFDVTVISIALPLAISFFTFQQIAFLIGIYEGSDRVPGVLRYAAFITFFPHLIAGPVLHHKEIQPQFGKLERHIPWNHVWIGIGLFSLGLFKKIMIADSIAVYVDPLYAQAATGTVLSMYQAWIAAFSYGLQIYFDFSGYSDMALGLAHLFGITLPRNFGSPYKSTSMIQLWQRWHMTLTHFMTSYVYNPMTLWITRRRMAKGLKVSTRPTVSPEGFFAIVVFPTVITMIVIGLWHGPNIQFPLFGLMQGIFLSINHAWRSSGYKMKPAAGRTLTIICFMFSVVLFRAPTMEVAYNIYTAMFDFSSLADIAQLQNKTVYRAIGWIALSLTMAMTLPNALAWVREGEPFFKLKYAPNCLCLCIVLAVFLVCFVHISTFSVFLYFNF